MRTVCFSHILEFYRLTCKTPIYACTIVLFAHIGAYRQTMPFSHTRRLTISAMGSEQYEQSREQCDISGTQNSHHRVGAHVPTMPMRWDSAQHHNMGNQTVSNQCDVRLGGSSVSHAPDWCGHVGLFSQYHFAVNRSVGRRHLCRAVKVHPMCTKGRLTGRGYVRNITGESHMYADAHVPY
jgi:hypothetical protein